MAASPEHRQPAGQPPSGGSDVEWTTEKVIRFWDGMVDRHPDSYFSAVHAPALASWIQAHVRPQRGRLLLDLGCGGGHLLAELGRRGHRVFGVDHSSRSLLAAGARIGVANVAEGSVTSIPLASRSVTGGVLLVETIEHVLEEDLAPMMAEVRRVLAPGSPLMITTPNAEDLDAAKVTCPECEARFHPMQHVRSWTASSLASFLRENGFSRVQTFETRLPAGTGVFSAARRFVYRVRGDKAHLLAVAQD